MAYELYKKENIFKYDFEVWLVYQMKMRKGILGREKNTLQRKQGINEYGSWGRGGRGAGKSG